MRATAAHSPVRGILAMVVSPFCFMSNDTVSKQPAPDRPDRGIIFVRRFFVYGPVTVVRFFRREWRNREARA